MKIKGLSRSKKLEAKKARIPKHGRSFIKYYLEEEWKRESRQIRLGLLPTTR